MSPKCKQSVSEWNSSTAAGGIASALQIAKAADAVVVVLGIDKSVEREGTDRSDTALPGLQEPFAHQVLALNKPTVLVLTNGGALAIDSLANPRAGQAGAAPYGILEVFNPAAFGGRAIGESLFGKANRFGKLPITMCVDHCGQPFWTAAAPAACLLVPLSAKMGEKQPSKKRAPFYACAIGTTTRATTDLRWFSAAL